MTAGARRWSGGAGVAIALWLTACGAGRPATMPEVPAPQTEQPETEQPQTDPPQTEPPQTHPQAPGAPTPAAPAPAAPTIPEVPPPTPRPATPPPTPPPPTPAPVTPPPRPPPAPAPPKPPPTAPGTVGVPPSLTLGLSDAEMRACSTPADCVISCDVDGTCCGSPCGCGNALNKDVAARLSALHRQSCPLVRERCPAVACMREDAFGATCQEGRCVALDRATRLQPYRPPSPPPPPAPPPAPAEASAAPTCATSSRSTLEGARVTLGAPCVVSLAAALDGVDARVTFFLPRARPLTVNKPDGGKCVTEGPAGVAFDLYVEGGGHRWRPKGDVGLCASGPTYEVNAPGGNASTTFRVVARDFNGPSDTSFKPGAAWPPGTYTIHAKASGTADGQPWVVEGSREIVITP